MIAQDIQSFSPSAIIELFEIDATSVDAGKFYFCATTNEITQPVVWQGISYYPIPIEATGFDISTQGTLPRPKVKVANLYGVFSELAYENRDLVGCPVIRRRTLMKYLDAVNFASGNPYADPNQHFSDDLYYIDKKVSEDRYTIGWELASAFDLQNITLPRRQVIQNTCMWVYKSPECGYVGTASFDISDTPTTPDKDVCGRRLSSCECRHPNLELPFGAYPGAQRYGS